MKLPTTQPTNHPQTPASPSADSATDEQFPSLGEAGATRQSGLTRQRIGGGEGRNQRKLTACVTGPRGPTCEKKSTAYGGKDVGALRPPHPPRALLRQAQDTALRSGRTFGSDREDQISEAKVSESRGDRDRRRTSDHHPKTEVVEPTVRGVPAAAHGSGTVAGAVPCTAPQDAGLTSIFLNIVWRCVFIETPLPDVTAQVQQAVGRSALGIHPYRTGHL